MINAAIVGLGRWGRRLVDSVQRSGSALGPNIRFSHAVVRTLESAQEYADDQHLTLTCSINNILADKSVEAVVLATPHHEHTPQILAATAANKHVFVEKPLAFRLADAEAAVAAAKRRELVLAVGFNRRFLPAAKILKRQISDGAFGELLRLEGNFSNNLGLNYREGMWRATESGPKAALSAMGVHILDFFVYLCGPIESVRVTSNHRAMPVDADDVVSVDLTLRNGVMASITTILTSPRVWRVQVFGTSQWAHMRDEHLLDIYGKSATIETKDFGLVDTLRLELESFANVIAGDTACVTPPDEMLHVTAALEAILESADNGGARVVVPRTSAESRERR